MITIVYSEASGNFESLAFKASRLLFEFGIRNLVVELSDLCPDVSSRMSKLVALVSVWDEGRCSSDGLAFYENSGVKGVDPRILQLAVLSLGDNQFDLFCQFGNDLESELDDCAETQPEKMLKLPEVGLSAS